jgi:hypothetical protein
MVEVLVWTSSLAYTSLIYYSISTLRGVNLYVAVSSRYVLLLQKDEKSKRHCVQVARRYPFASTWLKVYAHNEMVILKLSSAWWKELLTLGYETYN